MKERVRLIMESLKMTQQTFSKFLGISSAALSSIYNGRTRPTLAIVEAIHEKIPTISMNWLLYGEGEMYSTPSGGQGAKNESVAAHAQQPMLEFEEEPVEPVKVAGMRTKKSAIERNSTPMDMKIVDSTNRHIIEIKVYYDDLTYESFVPAKTK